MRAATYESLALLPSRPQIKRRCRFPAVAGGGEPDKPLAAGVELDRPGPQNIATPAVGFPSTTQYKNALPDQTQCASRAADSHGSKIFGYGAPLGRDMIKGDFGECARNVSSLDWVCQDRALVSLGTGLASSASS